jgi:hypothetical protein
LRAAAALEHAETDSLLCHAIRLQDIADLEAGQLVFAEPGGQRHRVEDVIAVAVPPLACDL